MVEFEYQGRDRGAQQPHMEQVGYDVDLLTPLLFQSMNREPGRRLRRFIIVGPKLRDARKGD